MIHEQDRSAPFYLDRSCQRLGWDPLVAQVLEFRHSAAHSYAQLDNTNLMHISTVVVCKLYQRYLFVAQKPTRFGVNGWIEVAKRKLQQSLRSD